MIGDFISKFASRRNVSWRKCGLNGEHRRPIFHRFEIIGGHSGGSVIAQTILKSNPLLKSISGDKK